MPFTLAGQLAQRVPVVRIDDSIGLVAENLRASAQGVVAVLDRVTPDATRESEKAARVVGLIRQKDLERATEQTFAPSPYESARLNGTPPSGNAYSGFSNGNSAALNGSFHGEHSEDSLSANGSPPFTSLEARSSPQVVLQSLKARDVMLSDVPFVPSQFSLSNALLTLDRYDATVMPVVDGQGQYLGLITRADIISAMCGNVRPPVVGGMATPLGVWLTEGVLTGGVGNLGLLLSGLTMAFCYAVAQVCVILLAHALNPAWGAAAASGRLGATLDGTGILNSAFFFIHSLLFFGMFRLLPLSGVHAAEHQTVHALERGLPLTVENVEKMPRAHPRCGTNLMAIAGIVLVGVAHLPSFDPEMVLFVLIIAFFAWRSLGEFIQVVFTTRPASRKQLEQGIRAANELMAKYQAQPFAVSNSPLRILNRGMIFAAIGMSGGLFIFFNLIDYIARTIS